VRDFVAMFKDALKDGKEAIEVVSDIIMTEYVHLAKRVWLALGNSVRGEVAQWAPDVHYCLENCT